LKVLLQYTQVTSPRTASLRIVALDLQTENEIHKEYVRHGTETGLAAKWAPGVLKQNTAAMADMFTTTRFLVGVFK
jgi:hypothetical protein